MILRPAALALVLLVPCAARAADEAAPKPAPFPHEVSPLKPDPAVRWGVLPNGIRWCAMHNEQPKEKVSLRIQVQSGSLDESDPQRGLAHFLEHMAFNGSAHYPPGDVVTVLQKLGCAFGADSNAHTTYDETVYKLDLPDAQAATLATGLQVLADFTGGMLIEPKEVDRERGVILAEMRDRNSPDFRMRIAFFRSLYAGMLLPERFTIGLQETVAAGSPQLLRDFYEQWYRPERMVLAVVGAIDTATIDAAITTAFGGLTAMRPAKPDPAPGALADDELHALVVHEPEAEGTEITVALVRPRPKPHDSADERHLLLLQDLGEQILSRRLSEIAEKDPQGPLLGGSAYSYQWLDLFHAGVDAQVRPGRALDGVAIIEHELRRFLEHGPTASELAVVQANMDAALDSAIAQQANRPNRALAGALYTSVHHDEVFMSPQQVKDLMAPWVAAATARDVTAAMAESWKNGRRVVAAMGKEDLGAEGEARVKRAWDAAHAEPVAAPAAQAKATWAYGDKPAAGAIADDQVTAHDIRQITFANRASATLKRTEFKPGEVLVRVRLQIRPEPRQPGIDEMLGRAFMLGGLGKHPLRELREVLAGTTAQVNGPGVDEDGVVFGGSCLPKDLELCLQELRAYLTDPGWRPEAEAQAKSGWLDELKSLDTNLDARVGRRFQELAVHGAPQRRAATLAEAEAVTLADARAWAEPVLAKAPLTIAICGDIDVAKTADLVASYVGSLPPRDAPRIVPDGEAPGALAASEPLPQATDVFDVPGSVARSLIEVAWPTADFFDCKRTRRLGLLAQLLTERLRVRVRQEFGQAYSPYAFHVASQAYAGFGYLGAQAGVEPTHAEEARKLVVAEARGLAEKGVTDEMLAEVKTPVVKNLAARRQQNQYWLDSVMIQSPWQPQRLEWAATMEADYASVTADELAALAKTYFAGDASLQIVGVCHGSPADAAQAKAVDAAPKPDAAAAKSADADTKRTDAAPAPATAATTPTAPVGAAAATPPAKPVGVAASPTPDPAKPDAAAAPPRDATTPRATTTPPAREPATSGAPASSR